MYKQRLKIMETVKVNTWLPCFDGFYGTIWEADETQEIEYINEQRAEKGLDPVSFDEMQFNYKDYELQVIKGIANQLENRMSEFISKIEIERVVSPREYNFANDSANVIITLTEYNINAIENHLMDNETLFAEYLKDKYTSRSGFISYYPNTIEGFIDGNLLEALNHEHKLGSILQFIAQTIEEPIESLDLFDNVEKYLSVINYNELVPE